MTTMDDIRAEAARAVSRAYDAGRAAGTREAAPFRHLPDAGELMLCDIEHAHSDTAPVCPACHHVKVQQLTSRAVAAERHVGALEGDLRNARELLAASERQAEGVAQECEGWRLKATELERVVTTPAPGIAYRHLFKQDTDRAECGEAWPVYYVAPPEFPICPACFRAVADRLEARESELLREVGIMTRGAQYAEADKLRLLRDVATLRTELHTERETLSQLRAVVRRAVDS